MALPKGERIKVQITLAPDVYDRIKTMADLRGVTVAAYIAYVAAESSLAALQFSEAIANFPATAIKGVGSESEPT